MIKSPELNSIVPQKDKIRSSVIGHPLSRRALFVYFGTAAMITATDILTQPNTPAACLDPFNKKIRNSRTSASLIIECFLRSPLPRIEALGLFISLSALSWFSAESESKQ